MNLRDRLRRIGAAFAALLLAQPALADPQGLPKPVAPVLEAVPAKPLKPALWMVRDADTTIYLFGTIHALKPGLAWFDGAVAQAFAESGTLVTEIADPTGTDVAQTLLGNALLPANQSLRGMMNAEDKAAFEAALDRNRIPAIALDRLKPWYAAVMLSTLPLLKAGYQMDQGVDVQLGAKARDTGKSREALETAAYQLGLFDALPQDRQLAYLRQVVDNLDQINDQIDTLIGEWGEGDADGLAKAMNQDEDVAGLSDALLTRRNQAWAEWIRKRLDQPGTVFVAVGAGHLAGPGSVQDQLRQSGVLSTRVQ